MLHTNTSSFGELQKKKKRKEEIAIITPEVQLLEFRLVRFPSCLCRMVSLTTLLELCRNSSVCGIDGIPQGRLGLVSLVRPSWTNTPPPRRAACVRPACRPHPPVFAASTFHLVDPVPAPLSFCPISGNFNWYRKARPPRRQRGENWEQVVGQCSAPQAAVWGQAVTWCAMKTIPSWVNSVSAGLHKAT